MEDIIKKAIEGGYKPLGWFDPYTAESRGFVSDGTEIIAIYGVDGDRTTVNMLQVVMSPLFWQALGKACGWYKEEHLVYLIPDGIDYTKALIYVEDNLGTPLNPADAKRILYLPYNRTGKGTWIKNALRFHEINLTSGWDKAVEYLQEITN